MSKPNKTCSVCKFSSYGEISGYLDNNNQMLCHLKSETVVVSQLDTCGWFEPRQSAFPASPDEKGEPMSSDTHDFAAIANEVGKLVAEKNKAYGNSFAESEKVFKLLYPLGVGPGRYKDMLCVVRVLDKLFRIATDRDALGENPWRDICGYAILALANANRKEE